MGRWAAHFAGVRLIIHSIHGWGFHRYSNKIIKTFFIFLESITAKITDRLIAVTQADIETGLKYGIGTREKYRLIRYGINKEEFNINADGTDTPLVGMIACFKPQKDHTTFIKAFARATEKVPAARAIFAGDGAGRAGIEALIELLGLEDKVILAGWRRDISTVMASIDILVLSTHHEGLPLVILEAMAAGRPVIASDVCGINEIVRDGENGYLVRPGDAAALADKMIALLKDAGLRRRMGKRGRDLLTEEFEEPFMFDKINSLYEELAC